MCGVLLCTVNTPNESLCTSLSLSPHLLNSSMSCRNNLLLSFFISLLLLLLLLPLSSSLTHLDVLMSQSPHSSQPSQHSTDSYIETQKNTSSYTAVNSQGVIKVLVVESKSIAVIVAVRRSLRGEGSLPKATDGYIEIPKNHILIHSCKLSRGNNFAD